MQTVYTGRNGKTCRNTIIIFARPVRLTIKAQLGNARTREAGRDKEREYKYMDNKEKCFHCGEKMEYRMVEVDPINLDEQLVCVNSDCWYSKN